MKGKTGSSGATCKPLITDERILHGIIDGSFIPTFVIDKDHCVQHWNRALEEISKIPASSIIGNNEHWRAFYGSKRPCMAASRPRSPPHTASTMIPACSRTLSRAPPWACWSWLAVTSSLSS